MTGLGEIFIVSMCVCLYIYYVSMFNCTRHFPESSYRPHSHHFTTSVPHPTTTTPRLRPPCPSTHNGNGPSPSPHPSTCDDDGGALPSSRPRTSPVSPHTTTTTMDPARLSENPADAIGDDKCHPDRPTERGGGAESVRGGCKDHR